MPKAQLTFPSDLIGDKGKKLKVAAHFSGTALGKGTKVGDEVIVETNYRDAQSLVKLVILMHKVNGTELDNLEETKEEPKSKPEKAK